jgi:alkylation response protein AidB-like acyl-CoA dehydrogenase
LHLRLQDGFTVILVERGPGVETKQIKTSYSTTAGTAYITFDNARAPVGNTLGEEGGGIFVILRSALNYILFTPMLLTVLYSKQFQS